ncbi:hypothetical protein V6N13_042989 [Hibiscus sabdariffa]
MYQTQWYWAKQDVGVGLVLSRTVDSVTGDFGEEAWRDKVTGGSGVSVGSRMEAMVAKGELSVQGNGKGWQSR